MSPQDIDLVIHATSTPDDLFGTGPQVASMLGADKAVAFDLTAACSGFVFALTTAAQYVRSGSFKNAVVIGADCLSRWVDWSDRNTCVLFGDGAGAVVITATDAEKDARIQALFLGPMKRGLPKQCVSRLEKGQGHINSYTFRRSLASPPRLLGKGKLQHEP
ncbi:fabH [Symbiodinium pilosum]|uniref:FabH protein n=1 Tax=Symbiodinium pilosum TaxID=2952 RepID=A0A812TUZ0_SYMPI|nr:fabH [Symbiodinium pilosum]